MFELTEVLDLQNILTQSLQYAPGDGGVVSPRVLNQEKDGAVIYTWDGPSPYNQSGPTVSHIGLYDPSTQANKILWINDSEINISTCSVNLDRTLLAYSICDTTRGRNKAVYRAFLAEIYPHKRVFSLNIERPHFLRVQFLYGSAGAKPEKLAHMLLFLHKESIGLYHIPLARVEKGIIMSDQPVTEQLVKRFIWCQWESLHQRLYYIVARRMNRQDSISSGPKHVLSCLQFSQNSKYEHMLDLPLNMNFPNIKPNTRSDYLDLPFCQGIPDESINMSALSLTNGTLCICYQHPVTPTKQEMEDSAEVDIDYTITMPHHARELQGSVCKVPWSVAEKARLSFSWLNDYVMVFLPGQFVHALNVSIEFEPCHHIILHKKSWEECLEEDEQADVNETDVKHVSRQQEPVSLHDETGVKHVSRQQEPVSLHDETGVKHVSQQQEPVSLHDETGVKHVSQQQEPVSLHDETGVKHVSLEQEPVSLHDETGVKHVSLEQEPVSLHDETGVKHVSQQQEPVSLHDETGVKHVSLEQEPVSLHDETGVKHVSLEQEPVSLHDKTGVKHVSQQQGPVALHDETGVKHVSQRQGPVSLHDETGVKHGSQRQGPVSLHDETGVKHGSLEQEPVSLHDETGVKHVSQQQEPVSLQQVAPLRLPTIASQTNVKDVSLTSMSTDPSFSIDSVIIGRAAPNPADLKMQFKEETTVKHRISLQSENSNSDQTQTKKAFDSPESQSKHNLEEKEVKQPIKSSKNLAKSEQDPERTEVKQPIKSTESDDQSGQNPERTEVKQPMKSTESVVQSEQNLERTEVKQPMKSTESVDQSEQNPERTEVKKPIKSVNETSEKSPAFHDGSNNTVLAAKSPPDFPSGPEKFNIVTNNSSHLGHLCSFFRKQSANNASCVYDCQSGKVYQVGVDMSLLVYLFSACSMASTRLAILHYVIRQGRELNILKQLFEMIANDCASPEVPILMQEFLVGLTYSNLRRQVEKDVFKLLPFTTSETFRGAFEKINSGERLSRISYVLLHSMNIGTKSVRERQQRRLAEDLWDNLCLHLRSRQLDQPNRFSQERVQQEYRDLMREIEKGRSPSALSLIGEKDSFLGKISARARRSLSLPPAVTVGRSDSVLGSLPPFLSEGALHPQQNKLIHLTERLFAAHLGKYLRKDSKIKVTNVGKEYISCQMQQSKQLCHMLWSIRGPASHSDYIPVNERATEEEYELFQLFERFYMAVQELAYPVPPGFHTYFTLMGFRTLELSLFLQYVDRGVLMLTGEFVAQIMEDLLNDEENTHIKLQIISRLPKPLAEECFQKWDHPIAYRHTAIQQVSVLLRDHDERDRNRGSAPLTMTQPASFGDSPNSEGIHSVFHPLDTLLDFMHEKEMESHSGVPYPAFDPQFIRDVATYHTTHDLSTINF